MGAGERGYGAGKRIGAAMAAQQRHDRRAILGNGDDRRLGALVGDERRHRADQYPGGAQADDRRAGGEERGDVRHGLGVVRVGRDAALERRVEARARQMIRQAPGERDGARAKDDDGRTVRRIGGAHRTGSALRRRRIIEK